MRVILLSILMITASNAATSHSSFQSRLVIIDSCLSLRSTMVCSSGISPQITYSSDSFSQENNLKIKTINY